MDKSFFSRFRVFIFMGLFLLIFAAWFGWASYSQALTQLVEVKVKLALDQSMQSLSTTLPRLQVTDRQSGEEYYAPDLNSKFHAFDLYGQALVLLNEDTSVPLLKLTQVSMSAEYGSSTTTITGQAAVDFPLIFGINKHILVRSSIEIPHFKTAGTGN
jgi:hypothetical protein